MLDVILKQRVRLSDACVARDTARRHVARPGIWLGPDTGSRALKSVVHVVRSKLGSPVVSRSRRECEAGEGEKRQQDTQTHRQEGFSEPGHLLPPCCCTLERRESEDDRCLQHGRAASQARSLRGSCFQSRASRTHTGGATFSWSYCMRCCLGTASRLWLLPRRDVYG